MSEVEIKNVTVKFPYEPYQVQRDYMGKVIKSLHNGKHAFLESPTGTGKTLSLLCSTLAWIEKQKSLRREVPLVIYSSRTHSQLKQAMNEMKRSAYGYMNAAVIASRQQLCINDDLKSLSNTEKIRKCDSLTNRNPYVQGASVECAYYESVDYSMTTPDFNENTIIDIEDLVKIGKKLRCCPYFAAKKIVDDRPEILFVPYNYLLDPKIRFLINGKLPNSIIIFDEAHNVSKMCEEMASTSLTSTTISKAINEIDYVIEKRLLPAENNRNIKKIRTSIRKLEKELCNCDNGSKRDGDFIFSLLKKAKITKNSIDIIEEMYSKLKNNCDESLSDELDEEDENDPNGAALRKIASFMNVVFSTSNPSLKKHVKVCFKAHIEDDNKQDGKKLHFWCFSPIFGIKYLLERGVRNLIFTSGTLSPLDTLIAEMDIPNSVQHISQHVIQPKQIYIKVVDAGPDGEELNSCYDNRKNDQYLISLGSTIIELAQFVPDGMLVFFPSYSVMNLCMTFWINHGIWPRIERNKPIFIEGKNEFTQTISEYYTAVDNGSGAVFMAVMRGKVSEGLDFSDKYGRAAIVAGLPLAPCMDPKIELKRCYQNDARDSNDRMLSGYEWYNLDGIKAINQAIGRVIRHKNDYGAILFCESRLNQRDYNKYISSWIRNELKITQQSFEEIKNDLALFYRKSEQLLPNPVNGLPQIDLDEENEEDEDKSADEEDEQMSSSQAGSAVKIPQDISIDGTPDSFASYSAKVDERTPEKKIIAGISQASVSGVRRLRNRPEFLSSDSESEDTEVTSRKKVKPLNII